MYSDRKQSEDISFKGDEINHVGYTTTNTTIKTLEEDGSTTCRVVSEEDIAKEQGPSTSCNLSSSEDSADAPDGSQKTGEGRFEDANAYSTSKEPTDESDKDFLSSRGDEETRELSAIASTSITDVTVSRTDNISKTVPIELENRNDDVLSEEHVDVEGDDTNVVSATDKNTGGKSLIASESLPILVSPIIFEDLTDGLSLDLELDSEIVKAFGNIDDFVSSWSDDEFDDDDDDSDVDGKPDDVTS